MATLLSRSARAKISVFRKNGIFLLKNVFISDFLARIQNQCLRIDLCAKFQLHWSKGKGTRILTWNDTKNGLMTSYLPPGDDVNKIFTAFERFCPEYHHAKFGCKWTTNKGETEGGGGTICPPAYIVPKDPCLNRVYISKFYNLKHK